MNSAEKDILKELGVPTDPAPDKTMILSVSAHLDWDWEFTFPQYYNAPHFTSNYWKYPVRQIFSNAIQYVNASKEKTPPYFYSISVVDYLKKYAGDRPDWFQQLLALGDRFRIVGGGVTSPDNLLPNGETLIRTYLITDHWLREQVPKQPASGIPPLPETRQAWVPDDFGHSAGFPIVLQALGLHAVGFSRVPTSTGIELTSGPDKGVDFIWQAADGSQVLAHWMQGMYYQGQKIHPTVAIDELTKFTNTNDPAAPTPYSYVPVSIDFGQPVESIREVAALWNESMYEKTGVWVVGATFDHYARLVECYRDTLHQRTYPQPGQSESLLPFQGTPYWTGFYGSRAELKSLHQEATRALVGAEVAGLLRQWLGGKGVDPDVAAAWWNATPSTHHDYITGTSVNAVYKDEQIPLLQEALQTGNQARTAAVAGIAAACSGLTVPDASADLGNVETLPVIVFNQLGFARGGLVMMRSTTNITPASFTVNGVPAGPVQTTADGHWCFWIPSDTPVPSLGYLTIVLQTAPWNGTWPKGASFRLSPDGTTVTLENDRITATATEQADWCLESLDQKMQNGKVVPTFPSGKSQQTRIYNDGGTLYQFGNEKGLTFEPLSATFTPNSAKVVDGGPVYVEIELSGNYQADGETVSVVRTFALAAGSPFVRITTRSAAPDQTSLFEVIPWGPTHTFHHGEPVHWVEKRAVPAGQLWPPPIFQPAHNFVLPRLADGTLCGGIYQCAMPAWAVLPPDGELMGCLMRNVADYDGAPGDPDPHTVAYALRVPAGLGDAASGNPLAESLAWTTPLIADVVTGTPPSTFSLAAVSSPDAGQSTVMISAAKPPIAGGEGMILRIIKTTNHSQTVEVDVSDSITEDGWVAYPISALERAETKGTPIPVSGGKFSFTAEFALTTLLIEKPT